MGVVREEYLRSKHTTLNLRQQLSLHKQESKPFTFEQKNEHFEKFFDLEIDYDKLNGKISPLSKAFPAAAHEVLRSSTQMDLLKREIREAHQKDIERVI